MSTELDDRIRATVHTIAHGTADPISWRDINVPRNALTPTRHRPRNLIVAAGALLIVLAGATIAFAIRNRSGEISTTSRASVVHAVFEFSQTSRGCPTSHGRGPSDFDRARIDTWYDATGERYRSRTTYPDGSTLDQVYLGIPERPSAVFRFGRVFSRGQWKIGPGCAGVTAGPVLPQPWASTSAPNGVGRPVEGTVEDSRGRASWRRRSSGTMTVAFGNGAPQLATETTTYFLEPHTARLLEVRYRLQIPTGGEFSSRLVKTRQDRLVAPRQTFSTRGYQSPTTR